jgi:hypothetical protein
VHTVKCRIKQIVCDVKLRRPGGHIEVPVKGLGKRLQVQMHII